MENGLVLIVDDRAQSRKQIADEFRERGYRTIKAAIGHEGWWMFRSHSPAAVVTDTRMPHSDAMDLIERIRSRFSAPVFCLTAHPDLDAGLLAMRRGAQYYYRRPQDLEMLVEDVDTVLTKSSVLRSEAGTEPNVSLSDFRTVGTLKTDQERRSAIVADGARPMASTNCWKLSRKASALPAKETGKENKTLSPQPIGGFRSTTPWDEGSPLPQHRIPGSAAVWA